MPINILNQHPCVRIPRKRLLKSLQILFTELGIESQEASFLFVSDREIRKYNRRFLNHDYATDVIAFEMNEQNYFGDIIISSDTAKRQAKEQGHSFFMELLILAIHGTLHLLGYRDKKKKDQEAMWKETERLIHLAGKS